MERIVRVWVKDNYMDIEWEFDDDQSEDECWEFAVAEVFDTLSVELI